MLTNTIFKMGLVGLVLPLSILVIRALGSTQLTDDCFKIVWNDDYSSSLTIDNHVTMDVITPVIATSQLVDILIDGALAKRADSHNAT